MFPTMPQRCARARSLASSRRRVVSCLTDFAAKRDGVAR
jgi:hypothetical protein